MLNVLYQFNEKYVPYAGVSIVSLLENNKDINSICIYVLCDDVCEESINRLLLQVKKYQRQIIVIDAKEVVDRIKSLGINSYRDSYVANIKMFVNDYIPSTVDRIVYIDSDTLICDSISQLVDIYLGDFPIAMTLDSVCKNHKIAIGFNKTDTYYNSGVILFDLKKWRELRCESKIIDILQKGRSSYMAPDQDLINLALKNQIFDLGPQYNLQPMHFVYDYKIYYRYFGAVNYYSEEQIVNAIMNPAIIHTFRYLGQFPWHKNSLHPNTELFDLYLEKSEWSDYQKEITDKNDFVFKVERWLYRVLPKGLFIFVFKIFYELFLWKANLDSKRKINNARM